MGGSGKTPFLKWVLKNLPQKDCVLISSRGHKSESESKGKIVNSGERFSANEIGDENVEILRYLKNGTVAIGRDRVGQISKCITRKSFSFLFLDDGFQHMKIGRDINVVLFNSLLEYEKLKVFPRGYLREGVGSLYEADVIIFTNCYGESFSKNEAAIRNIIYPFLSSQVKIYRSRTILSGIISLRGMKPFKDYEQEKFVLISAIANPEKVLNLLKIHQIDIAEKVFFPDHHFFSKKDYQRINEICTKHGASLLMTEKDSSKFDYSKVGIRSYYIDVDLDFFGQSNLLLNFLLGNGVV